MPVLAPVLAAFEFSPPNERPIEACGVFPSLAVAEDRAAFYQRQRPRWKVRFKDVIREVSMAEYNRSVVGCALP